MIIRVATHDDQPAIASMLPEFLKDLQPFGSLATVGETNVILLGQVIRRAIERSDPIVLAENETGIIGFCLWAGVHEPLEQTRKILHALGTYIKPAFREQGVGKSVV